MRDLSIVIISYNTKDLLKKCLSSILASLASSSLNYEVIVVDNGSTDGSQEIIKREFPSVRLMLNKSNLGYGKANNQAAKNAQGQKLLFLNSDIEVIDESIEKLVQFGKQDGFQSIYGGKLFNLDGSPQPSCGYFYTLPITFISLFLKGDQLHLSRSSPTLVKKTEWVSGACLMIGKNKFNTLGGFDEKIFMYMDEVDLCFRARHKGIDIIFYPEAVFTHIGSASSKDKRTSYINLFNGLLYFYKKHWPQKLVFLKVLLRLKAGLSMGIGYVLRNNSLYNNYRKAWNIIN